MQQNKQPLGAAAGSGAGGTDSTASTRKQRDPRIAKRGRAPAAAAAAVAVAEPLERPYATTAAVKMHTLEPRLNKPPRVTFVYTSPTTPHRGQSVIVPWRYPRGGDDDDDDAADVQTTISRKSTIHGPPPGTSHLQPTKINKLVSRVIQASALTPEEYVWTTVVCGLVASKMTPGEDCSGGAIGCTGADGDADAATATTTTTTTTAAAPGVDEEDERPHGTRDWGRYRAYLLTCMKQYHTEVTNLATIKDVLLVNGETHETTDLTMRGVGCLAAFVEDGSVFRSTGDHPAYCGQTRRRVNEDLYLAVTAATVCEGGRVNDPCTETGTVGLPPLTHTHLPGVCSATISFVTRNDDLILGIRLHEVGRVLAVLTPELLADAYAIANFPAREKELREAEEEQQEEETKAAAAAATGKNEGASAGEGDEEGSIGASDNPSRLTLLLMAVCFRVRRQNLADGFYYGMAGTWLPSVQALGPELMNRIDLRRDITKASMTEAELTAVLTASAAVVNRICVLCNRASHAAVVPLDPLDPMGELPAGAPHWLAELLRWVTRMTRNVGQPIRVPHEAPRGRKRLRREMEEGEVSAREEEAEEEGGGCDERERSPKRSTGSRTHPAAAAASAHILRVFSSDAVLVQMGKTAETWRKIVWVAATAIIDAKAAEAQHLQKQRKLQGAAGSQARRQQRKQQTSPAMKYWPRKRNCCSITASVLDDGWKTPDTRAHDVFVLGLMMTSMPACCLWYCRELYKRQAAVLQQISNAAAEVNTSAGDLAVGLVASEKGGFTRWEYAGRPAVATGAGTEEAAAVASATSIRGTPSNAVADLLVTAALGARLGAWDGPHGPPLLRNEADGQFSGRCRRQPPKVSAQELLLCMPSKYDIWGVGGVRERTLYATKYESEVKIYAAVQKCTALAVGTPARVVVQAVACPSAVCRAASPTVAMNALPCLTTIAADVGGILGVELFAAVHTPEAVVDLALGAHCLAKGHIERLCVPLIYVVVCPTAKALQQVQLKWIRYTNTSKRPQSGAAVEKTTTTADADNGGAGKSASAVSDDLGHGVSNILRLTPAWVCVLLLHPSSERSER